ncbi:hypothetical protein F4780DRAFT_603689 [Xylariomycetidae sp. FL0641]|nr:hypothetical protein F4780DRAFT_603689 [Xylariomycetidae sp. FL0641]
MKLLLLQSALAALTLALAPRQTTLAPPGSQMTMMSVVAAPSQTSSAVPPNGDPNDPMELYLCSNPDFNHNCPGCACESLTDIVIVGGYGGPPCYPLPDDLRVGNPQGVSSARSYSGWNCTLYDNDLCQATTPGHALTIPPGPPGIARLNDFDDRAVAYQCYRLARE